MAYLIRDTCINCGKCEALCPTSAIYAGGEPWFISKDASVKNGGNQNYQQIRESEYARGLQPPIEEYRFYIVPGKCDDCSDLPGVLCVNTCPIDDCIVWDADYGFLQLGENKQEKYVEKDIPAGIKEQGVHANQIVNPAPLASSEAYRVSKGKKYQRLKLLVNEKVAQGQINEALSLFSTILEEFDHKAINEIKLLESQLNSLNKKQLLATITSQEYVASKNDLIFRFLSIFANLDEEMKDSGMI